MSRRIAVFTSSRADLGPLGPVIAELDARPGVELVVIASGTHLASAFGGRLEDIELNGDSVLETIDVEIGGTESSELGEVYARVASGVSRVLANRSIDILTLLGDRWELLAAAGAALIHGVAIAHLHGGETTEGAIDERIRHGVTKLSDLHLCATEDSARRIRQLGEEPWRITITGAPGLDRVAEVVPMSDQELTDLVGQPIVRPLGVVVYHPPTVDRSCVVEEARAVFQTAAETLGTGLLLYPGADPGAEVVLSELRSAADAHDNLVPLKNLGGEYLRVLASADVLIGNSSSGIIEAASFKLPVVDVGDRQGGRLRPANVVHAATTRELGEALQLTLSGEFRLGLSNVTNPYGDGLASSRIVDALVDADVAQLARKPLVPAQPIQQRLPDLIVRPDATIREAMSAIDRGGLQIAFVVDPDGRLIGTISDGDIRRGLLGGAAFDDVLTSHVNRVPVVAEPEAGPSEILAAMQRAGVTQVPVVDTNDRLVGVHVMRAIVGELLDTALPSAGSGLMAAEGLRESSPETGNGHERIHSLPSGGAGRLEGNSEEEPPTDWSTPTRRLEVPGRFEE